MPFKYYQSHRHHFKKPASDKKRNWFQYNKKMKMRGDLAIWSSPDVVKNWYLNERHYDGNGAPLLYSDMAILTIHEIRQVFHLPLRQCERFINALLKLMNIEMNPIMITTNFVINQSAGCALNKR